MRVTGLLTLVLLIFAGQSFVNEANPKRIESVRSQETLAQATPFHAENLPKPARLPSGECTDQWTGTITYRIITSKKGSAENKVNFSYWNEEGIYETKAELDGRRNDQGAPLAIVRAAAHETKEWGGRGKSVCYRETDNSQAVRGTANETTTAFSITFEPRTREYSVLAPTLMVYAS